ncbi:ATPase [Bacillus thuringiensis]|uniref:Cd(2+)-exporting ATPase n=1 Tax=Bacillus thuringiensis TaxID=1428 RepID=A0A9W3X4I7_BACTU|nr:cation-translocating P-type ATPase [Bacillus thuringiensis]ANS52382.1 copper-exporting P-type ATPase A [Bacillus thuringiensis]MBH0337772.1 ATPase [Bacillus thuringiensis]
MFDSIHVVHSLPGRTRLQVKSTVHPVMIESLVRSLPQVFSATYTCETNSLLVYHDTALSFLNLKEWLANFLSFKRKLNQHIFSWRQLAPVAACAGVFLMNWYIQRNQLGPIWKTVAYWVTMTTSVFTSYKVIKDGIANVVKERKANANTLTTASIFASFYLKNPGSALIITLMSTISELLTAYTSEKTKQYIHSVLELDIAYAWRLNEQQIEQKVRLEHIQVEDTVVVFTGEKIPVDGVVLAGIGVIDESSITGEYMPKEVGKGAQVYAGSILQNGQLHIRVEKIGDDTAISRIVKLLEEAQEKQAPIQNIADTLAEKMVPVSFGLAIATFILTRNMNRTMNMLVIDFICGIKLSTATALYAGMGKAAKKGAIIKGSNYLEELAKVGTVVLDKTGTITEGTPVVEHVIPCEGYEKEDVIKWAAVVERNSSHPIAEAVIKQADEWGIKIPKRDDNVQVDTIVGKGICTYLEGKHIAVGSLRFMKELQVNMESGIKNVDKDANIIYVAYNRELVGTVRIFDKIRSGMYRTIRDLRQQGIKDVIMLTGDKQAVAQEMSDRLGLDRCHAEALPEDKTKYVKIYGRKNRVMMVGDGINDAPALAHANVGVTMGAKRTDIASEASDIIITSDHPEMLSELIGLSKKTMNVIKQNFIVTFVINGAAILFGAVGIFSPVIGAAIHNAATIGVVCNSARILWEGDGKYEAKVLYST